MNNSKSVVNDSVLIGPNKSIKLTESDIVNPDEWIPESSYNPHGVRLWVFHDHGFVVCAAFAESLQDALDEAADSGKIDHFKVNESESEDYGGNIYDCERLSYLGNSCDPYDIESLDFLEIGEIGRSICAMIEADQKRG